MLSDRNQASPLEFALLDGNIRVVLLLLICLLVGNFVVSLRLWLVVHRSFVGVFPIDHLLEPSMRVDLSRPDLQIHDLIRLGGLIFEGRLEGAYPAGARNSA